MENNIFWIVLIIGIPFLIVAFTIEINNRLKSEKIKLENKGNSLINLINKKINITTNFVDYNKEEFNKNSVISNIIINLEQDLNNDNNVEKKLKSNDNLNIILEQLGSNMIENQIYKDFLKEIEEINNQMAYSASLYNENVNNYNSLLKKIPYNLVAKIFGYKEYKKFNLNR